MRPYLLALAAGAALALPARAADTRYHEDAALRAVQFIDAEAGWAVPGLNFVRFGDAETGYLAGDGTDQYPTGLFLTTDGGRHWAPIKGQRCTSWLGGDFLDGKTGALAGSWSRLGSVRNGDFGNADV